MRQTIVLSPPRWSLGRGVCAGCRESLAGPWPFPTLSLPSLWRCLDPYPAVFVRCAYPFLPQRQRPHVTGNTFGTRENPCKAISPGSVVSGLQSFAHVQAPPLARPPDRSHRSPQTGRPGRLPHASPKGLPTSGCGIATCLIWATDMAGLPPARWQPCRLLLPASGSSVALASAQGRTLPCLLWPAGRLAHTNPVRHVRAAFPFRAACFRRVLPHVVGFPHRRVLRSIRLPNRIWRAFPLPVLLRLPIPMVHRGAQVPALFRVRVSPSVPQELYTIHQRFPPAGAAGASQVLQHLSSCMPRPEDSGGPSHPCQYGWSCVAFGVR